MRSRSGSGRTTSAGRRSSAAASTPSSPAAVLAHPELAGRDVQQGDARSTAPVAARRARRKLFVVPLEVGRVGERAGRDHPHDVAAQELLALAPALELLADRDLLAGLDQPGDVALGGVVGDAGHRRALSRGQRDRQQARPQLGILEEQLVEVAEAEQQQMIREPALQLPVLRHHRRAP